MILDASIVVAMAFNEPTVPWIERHLQTDPSEPLRMGWINMAEAGMSFRRQKPTAPNIIEPLLLRLGVLPLDLDHDIVRLAVEARSRFPLNFGDCFAYAHARLRNETLVTLDDDFLATDLPRLVHPARPVP